MEIEIGSRGTDIEAARKLKLEMGKLQLKRERLTDHGSASSED